MRQCNESKQKEWSKKSMSGRGNWSPCGCCQRRINFRCPVASSKPYRFIGATGCLVAILVFRTMAFAQWSNDLHTCCLRSASVNDVSEAPARSNAPDLTGFWIADDGATYYVLQDGGVVWWAGFSADGGRSFTNVYRGIWHPNTATEEPADIGTIDGDWADVPLGDSNGGGTLRLSLRLSGDLVKLGETGGFGASNWRKTNMDKISEPPRSIKKTYPSHGDLSDIWAMNCGGGGTYYLRQVGNTVWWLGLNFQQNGPTFGEVFHGTIQANRLRGTVVILPWPWTTGSGSSGLELDLNYGPSSRTISVVTGSAKKGCSWNR